MTSLIKYRVKKGESIVDISGYNNENLDIIRSINNYIVDVVEGDIIEIPKSLIKYTKRNAVPYILKRKDSLWKLAREDEDYYKILIRWNGTKPLYSGQLIFIPQELYPKNQIEPTCKCLIS